MRGVGRGAVLFRAQPDKGAVSPAAILRRRHRREGAAPFSARYPAGVGAATEVGGSAFSRKIMKTMAVERVIVRRMGVLFRRVGVAVVVGMAVEWIREWVLEVVVGFRMGEAHFRTCFDTQCSFFGTQYSFRRSTTSFSTRSVPFDPLAAGFVALGVVSTLLTSVSTSP